MDDVESLIKAYPENLYELPKEELGNSAGTAMSGLWDDQGNDLSKDKSVYDGAYVYQPAGDDDARDIRFYTIADSIVAIELFSPAERRNFSAETNLEQHLTIKPSNEAMEFKTTIEAEGEHQIPVTWADLGNVWDESAEEPASAEVKYKLIKLDQQIPQSEIVNGWTCSDALMSYVELVESGRGIEYVQEARYLYLDVECKVERYKDVIAVVIEGHYGLYEGCGGQSFTVFYYDANTCNWISAEEYADRCGIDKDTIVKLYNQELSYLDMEAYNIYDAEFYINAEGEVIIGWNWW